jgi:hypothetical protein
MKTALARVLPVLSFFVFTEFAIAGDLVSTVVQTTQTITITVPPDRFLVIRNFTQDGTGMTATMRGSVSVISNGSGPVTVMTATIVDPSNTTTLEPVNDVVIAGPATATVHPGNTTCFITYRKGTD